MLRPYTEQCLALILTESDRIDVDYVDTKSQTRLHMIKEETSVPVVELLYWE